MTASAMDPNLGDEYRALAAGYAIGALGPAERANFEAHLESGCLACREALKDAADTISALSASMAPDRSVRAKLLDLALAPCLPIEPAAYSWESIAPGIRLHVLKEDPSRGMKACLVWADPGAKNEAHRHLGDEIILVLEGAIRDDRGEYGPGQICSSRAGSVHFEEVLDRGTCFSYVVYYGPLEYLPS